MDQFLQELFSKAQEKSGEKSLRKWAEYIADYLSEEIKYPLSVKTLERYYNGESEPNMEKKDKLATFLGYKDFREYLSANQELQLKNENEVYEENAVKEAPEQHKKYWLILVCVMSILPLGVWYWGYSRGSEECMIWAEDHYVVTPCEGKVGETEKIAYLLENFKEIQVSDSTTFFQNGRPIVWYDKYENELYFFTAPGINPETGKTVKEISEYMINKYIKQN